MSARTNPPQPVKLEVDKTYSWYVCNDSYCSAQF